MNDSCLNKNAVKESIDLLISHYGKENVEMLLSEESLFEPDGTVPFLSVVMRTRGTRPAMLSEVLLCLSAQTVQDFEVLLMGHNLSPEGEASVTEIVGSFPEQFREKIRVIKVDGGTRTTPLNRGFEEARGNYIVSLDDDDLVLDHWVETFRELYEKEAGKILHAYSVMQDWETVKSSRGESFVSTSDFNTLHCRRFDMVDQLTVNHCPFMSVAFPSYIFKKLGLRFNEELTTTEDWDFLMRASFVCGVADSKNITSIYRMWKTGDTSAALHKNDEWEENYRRIQRDFFEYSVALKVTDLRNHIRSVSSEAVTTRVFEHMEIFIDTGNGFHADITAKFVFKHLSGHWRVEITDPGEFGVIHAIRLDPDDYGVLQLSDIDVVLMDKGGNRIPCKEEFFRSNYIKVSGKYIFLCDDPGIVFGVEKPSEIAEMYIDFNYSKRVRVRLLCIAAVKYILLHFVKKIAAVFGGIKRKIKNLFRR